MQAPRWPSRVSPRLWMVLKAHALCVCPRVMAIQGQGVCGLPTSCGYGAGGDGAGAAGRGCGSGAAAPAHGGCEEGGGGGNCGASRPALSGCAGGGACEQQWSVMERLSPVGAMTIPEARSVHDLQALGAPSQGGRRKHRTSAPAGGSGSQNLCGGGGGGGSAACTPAKSPTASAPAAGTRRRSDGDGGSGCSARSPSSSLDGGYSLRFRPLSPEQQLLFVDF